MYDSSRLVKSDMSSRNPQMQQVIVNVIQHIPFTELYFADMFENEDDDNND